MYSSSLSEFNQRKLGAQRHAESLV